MSHPSDWTSGYMVEVDYTHGYYRELSPLLIDFIILLSGFEPPSRQSPRYLELGTGQGLSANIHAAAVDGEFIGTDFNPSHASNSMVLAEAAGSGAKFYDDSFMEFAQRDDLGEFDYIALHGIWSWVSDENRDVIVDIIRRRMKVGGAVYISYNSLPGWASAMPLRHLMRLYGQGRAPGEGILSSINEAIGFAQNLAGVGARYFSASPGAKERLDAIAGQDRSYLAHEYFNLDWLPMYFSDIQQRLVAAKLNFTSSANLLDHVPGINTTDEQSKLLATVTNPVLRETVRDYIMNQQFRKDIFTRGARRVAPLDRLERLNDVEIVLTTPVSDVKLTMNGGLGTITLREDIYQPVLEQLAAGDYSPKRIGDLTAILAPKQITSVAVIEAITVLVGAGHAHPAQSGQAVARVSPACRQLNEHLVHRARVSDSVAFLASPVIGGGVQVSRFEQLFLLARLQGAATPEEWARFAWETLAKQGQVLIMDGKPLEAPEDNLRELTKQAETLANHRMPLLKALKIA